MAPAFDDDLAAVSERGSSRRETESVTETTMEIPAIDVGQIDGWSRAEEITEG